jgi:hypothetical protein
MEVTRIEKEQIKVGACALLWAMWNIQNDYIFNIAKQKKIHTSYSAGNPLNLYVVLNTTNGQAQGDGFWVQSPRVGRMGYIYNQWRFDLRLAC